MVWAQFGRVGFERFEREKSMVLGDQWPNPRARGGPDPIPLLSGALRQGNQDVLLDDATWPNEVLTLDQNWITKTGFA